ncbi:MAG: ERCC4 domain-containing protein [Blautia sp.]|nr:ERCC4 domain-containing protein [Blautia sp.]
MIIQIDSREKARAISNIVEEFDRQGVTHPVSKLMVGDYMNYDNPRLIIDRKQNLSEICSNVTQDHDRFRRELKLAQDNEIRLVILIEHGKDIRSLKDVIWWDNPRRWKRVRDPKTGKWANVETKATTGETLYMILCTLERKYGCRFMFCEKKDTGREIIRILGGDYDQGRN